MKRPTNASLLKLDAIGGLCAAGIVTAVAMLGVAPLIAERHEREASEKRLVELRTETDHAVGVLRDTRIRLRARTSEAEQIPDHLRIRRDLNERIARIIEETESFGLTVQTISPGEPENDDRFKRTPIELSTRAPIDAIARYLHGLHESSPDLELTSLQIRDPDEAGVLNATIRAEWITLAD